MAGHGTRAWWLVDSMGLVSLVFGSLALALIWLGVLDFALLAKGFGSFAITLGVLDLLESLISHSNNKGWWLQAIGAAVSLGAGMLMFIWLGLDNSTMLQVVAGWTLVIGLIQALQGVRSDLGGEYTYPSGLAGVVGVAVAVVLVRWRPEAGMLPMAWLLAANVTFGGLMTVIRARSLRS